MEQSLFCVMIAGQAKLGMEDYIREHLTKLMHRSRLEEGCIMYHLHESRDTPGEFMVYMLWDSEALFEAHNVMPEMQEFKKQLAPAWFVVQSPKTYWQLL